MHTSFFKLQKTIFLTLLAQKLQNKIPWKKITSILKIYTCIFTIVTVCENFEIQHITWKCQFLPIIFHFGRKIPKIGFFFKRCGCNTFYCIWDSKFIWKMQFSLKNGWGYFTEQSLHWCNINLASFRNFIVNLENYTNLFSWLDWLKEGTTQYSRYQVLLEKWSGLLFHKLNIDIIF